MFFFDSSVQKPSQPDLSLIELRDKTIDSSLKQQFPNAKRVVMTNCHITSLNWLSGIREIDLNYTESYTEDCTIPSMALENSERYVPDDEQFITVHSPKNTPKFIHKITNIHIISCCVEFLRDYQGKISYLTVEKSHDEPEPDFSIDLTVDIGKIDYTSYTPKRQNISDASQDVASVVNGYHTLFKHFPKFLDLTVNNFPCQDLGRSAGGLKGQVYINRKYYHKVSWSSATNL
jgi:hypothetical protein